MFKQIKTGILLIRKQGFIITFKLFLNWLMVKIEQILMRIFDRIHGTETTGVVEWRDLINGKFVDHDGYGYVANPWIVKCCIKSLNIDYRNYVFIDVGSGKGDILLFASNFPFKNIIGIEIFKTLHLVAERNIATYKGEQQKCIDIKCLCVDVLDFEMPKEPTVCYLYNPFPNDVLKTWVENIGRSLINNPRPLYIIYVKPVHSRILDKAQFLLRKKVTKFPLIERLSYIIYEAKL
jgi:hypothetical protein